jgi:DNA polymerase III delta subunit
MLASRQLVFLEDVQQIEKLGEEDRAAAVQQLETYLDDPAPFTVLVLEATALDQRMRLAKIVLSGAFVVDIGPGDNPDQRLGTAVTMARAMAKEQQVEFERGAAEDLAEFVAADLMRLKTEVDKLAAHVGSRKLIRRQDVAAMVMSEKTTTVWELAGMLVAGQQKKALEFLDRLLRGGEEPLPMLGAMAWMYRKLIEASELKGLTASWQAARALGMRPEQAQLAVESAQRIPKARLLEGLQALQKADDQLKRGGEDARAVLEFLVTQLTSPKVSSR